MVVLVDNDEGSSTLVLVLVVVLLVVVYVLVVLIALVVVVVVLVVVVVVVLVVGTVVDTRVVEIGPDPIRISAQFQNWKIVLHIIKRQYRLYKTCAL